MTIDEVETFKSHFQKQIDVITSAKFCLAQMDRECKTLLLCSVIDSMSDIIDLPNCADPERPNKLKFLTAIERYGNWAACTRICRLYLDKVLDKVKTDRDFEPVRQFLAKKAWPDIRKGGQINVESIDPDYFELFTIWPKQGNKPREIKVSENKIGLRQLQNHSLLYELRNKLVHELRAPQMVSDLYPKQVHYAVERFLTDRYWILVYPYPFMVKLASSILSGLTSHCVDPITRLNNERKRCWFELL